MQTVPTTGSQGLLTGCRVLDLTDGGYLICGRLLADMGADVIQIEPPGGSPSRNIGPFYKDEPHPERSLFWFVYGLNKRGVTLDIETSDGRKILKELVKKADFIIESYSPGYLSKLGLGYPDLAMVNPRVIMVSITPFGQDGPKAQNKSSELLGFASSAVLGVTGAPDRPPVTPGYPLQATMQAGVEGVVAALIANWHRASCGEGQHVDVSMQDTNIQLLQGLVEVLDLTGVDYKRAGTAWVTGTGLKRDLVFPCKDGYVAFTVLGGSRGPAASTKGIVNWMDEDGMAPEWLKKIDWVNEFDVAKLTQKEFDRLQVPFAKFFLTKTKKDLWERGFRERIILAPLNTVADLWNFKQLGDRQMWVKVDHPELGEPLTYFGPFVKLSEASITYRRRAPTIGEDNQAIYMGELGLSKNELSLLKQARVI